MALHDDLVIPQGKSWVGPMWALLDANDAPYSLAGKSIRAQVRETSRAPSVLHEWTTEAGNVATFNDVPVELDDGTTVTTVAVALMVKPDESAAWEWRMGIYDVEIVDGADVWPLVEPSAVTVAGEVTR